MNCKHGLSIKIALVVMMSVFVPIVVAGAAEGLRRSDATIKADVAKTLRADRALIASRIIVKSVRNGVVVLSGSAASLNDYVRALRLTADRPGVRKVFSEIDAYDAVPAPSVAALNADRR